jgi:hypothetical protein
VRHSEDRREVDPGGDEGAREREVRKGVERWISVVEGEKGGLVEAV